MTSIITLRCVSDPSRRPRRYPLTHPLPRLWPSYYIAGERWEVVSIDSSTDDGSLSYTQHQAAT